MTIDDNTFVLGVIGIVGVAVVAIVRNVTRVGIEIRRITAREYEQRRCYQRHAAIVKATGEEVKS